MTTLSTISTWFVIWLSSLIAAGPLKPEGETQMSRESIHVAVELDEEFRETGRMLELPTDMITGGRHWFIRGGTRQGKTILFEYLVSQVINLICRAAVFILDAGDDRVLFHRTKANAEVAGRPFRQFSTDPRRSFFFPPFQRLKDPNNILEQCEQLIQAFQLFYGTRYGAWYYVGRALAALLGAGHDLVGGEDGTPPTPLALADKLKQRGDKDAEQIRQMIEFLTYYPQLRTGRCAGNG